MDKEECKPSTSVLCNDGVINEEALDLTSVLPDEGVSNEALDLRKNKELIKNQDCMSPTRLSSTLIEGVFVNGTLNSQNIIIKQELEDYDSPCSSPHSSVYIRESVFVDEQMVSQKIILKKEQVHNNPLEDDNSENSEDYQDSNGNKYESQESMDSLSQLKSPRTKHPKHLKHRDPSLLRFNCCHSFFATSSELNDHIARMHSSRDLNGKLICPFCGYGSENICRFKRHMSTHTGHRPFQCIECGKKFTQKAHMLRHELIHKRSPMLSCTECGEKFNKEVKLMCHLRAHDGLKPFICVTCGTEFTRLNSLKHHEMSIHKNQREFECSYCDMKFCRKRDLDIHTFVHTRQSKHKCPTCGKMFSTKTKLNRHVFVHTRENLL